VWESFSAQVQPQISKWLRANRQGAHQGHAWVTRQTLKKLAQAPVAAKPGRKSFYEKLGKLKKMLDSKQDLQLQTRLQSLISQGRREVPVFGSVWDEGQRLLSQADLSVFALKNYLCMLETPFVHLYLRPERTYTYLGNSKLRVGKILFFFGGYTRTSASQVELKRMTWRTGRYMGVLKGKWKSPQGGSQGWGELALSNRGECIGFTPKSISYPVGLENMARLLYRVPNDEFEDPSGSKTVFLGQHPGLSRDRIQLEMRFYPQGIEIHEFEPLLKVKYQLRELEADREDSLRIYGGGWVLLSADGVARDLENNVRFELNFLGLRLLRGTAMDRIRLKL